MSSNGKFPLTRLRRSRISEFSRRLVRETLLTPNDLIYPVFLVEGSNKTVAVESMPGVDRISLDLLPKIAEECISLGIPAIALFPSIENDLKTLDGREALNEKGLVPRSIRLLKGEIPELGVITDVALDPYTTHGQDGLLDVDGQILNDETVEILKKQALCYAASGVDIVAPSDMMDGRIGLIRKVLEENRFTDTQILAYASKFVSSFYGPFRDAVGSQKLLGKKGKETYQLDYANRREAIREAGLDIDEGADLIMVKPGLPYLDILWQLKQKYLIPTFVYQVSGEFAMLKAAFANGWLKEDSAILECLVCFKRAGADAILSYFALEAARLMRGIK